MRALIAAAIGLAAAFALVFTMTALGSPPPPNDTSPKKMLTSPPEHP
ncbi:SPW_0924 family protein [Streptomyces boninensis]